jgi:hypothetical protein
MNSDNNDNSSLEFLDVITIIGFMMQMQNILLQQQMQKSKLNLQQVRATSMKS